MHNKTKVVVPKYIRYLLVITGNVLCLAKLLTLASLDVLWCCAELLFSSFILGSKI